MKISIGSDHGGFELKALIKEHLAASGHEVADRGTDGVQSCDYPDFGAAVARDVAAGTSRLGIAICKSGVGMSIAANKVRGVRAALCMSPRMAELSRQHNDANVLVLGSMWFTQPAQALAVVDAWLDASFEGGRHAGRVEKITRLEKENPS